jgi:hypothetical protein
MGRGEKEVYWKAGFTVKGSTDTIVEEYCRSEREAAKKALDAAKEVQAELQRLAVTAEIGVWTMKWRVWRETDYEDKMYQTDLVVERPSEPRRLDRERAFEQAEAVEVKP